MVDHAQTISIRGIHSMRASQHRHSGLPHGWGPRLTQGGKGCSGILDRRGSAGHAGPDSAGNREYENQETNKQTYISLPTESVLTVRPEFRSYSMSTQLEPPISSSVSGKRARTWSDPAVAETSGEGGRSSPVHRSSHGPRPGMEPQPAARPTRQSGQSPESATGGPVDGWSVPVVARCSPANPEPENKRTSQIWFNPHFRPPKTSATPPQPPGPARVRPLAAIHINPAAQAWVGGPPGPGPNVHINPHKLHARQPVRHALSSTRITPWARPTLTPPTPAVRQILVNPHFARVPAQPVRPARPTRALAGTTPPRLESVTTPLRAWGVSGRSLAKFKKIGRHKLIKLKSPAPFWAALTGSAHRHRTLPAVGGTPTPPHRLRPRQTLAHLRQMLTPQAKSRRSVHRQIDRRPQTRPAPRPRPASPPLHPTGDPPPPLKPVPPPKPARTIQINGSAYRVSRNGRQLQRVHPGPVPLQPPVTPASVGPQRVYLAQGGEFVEAAPGILRLSRESMTRQSITHARKKSIQTLLRSQTKSKQFCMFFNKFGRCQKRAQGLCPYLHDPAKVAVCRRFLQGSCPKAADECLLTHKVSPDKMPACKFFQLGQCGRDHCPYNHVKVSADAALCPAFRQGYCPQGQACTLRHAMSDQTKAKVNPAPPKPRRKGVKEPKPVLPQSADPQPTLEPADSIMPSQRYFECAKDSPQADSPSTCPDPPVEVETKSQMAFWPEFIALEPDDEGASDPDQSFEERLV